MPLCTPWIDGEDVADCCSVDDASDTTIFDQAAEVASELLFNLSLRRFPGICERTVRPCRTGCACPWQVLEGSGYVIWNWNLYNPLYGWGSWNWGNCVGGWENGCGCAPLSRVLLAGYVQSVTEVLIDGDVVDPDTYRVYNHRWLVRVRPSADDQMKVWPGCQAMDLPETEHGTWAVTYTYGRDVPVSGQAAAAELACEIYKQCQNLPCKLPANTVRVARQGIVAERPVWLGWGFERGGRSLPRGWHSGMPQVDAFLNAFNPSGLQRTPLIWSPTARLRYAQEVGSAPETS